MELLISMIKRSISDRMRVKLFGVCGKVKTKQDQSILRNLCVLTVFRERTGPQYETKKSAYVFHGNVGKSLVKTPTVNILLLWEPRRVQNHCYMSADHAKSKNEFPITHLSCNIPTYVSLFIFNFLH